MLVGTDAVNVWGAVLCICGNTLSKTTYAFAVDAVYVLVLDALYFLRVCCVLMAAHVFSNILLWYWCCVLVGANDVCVSYSCSVLVAAHDILKTFSFGTDAVYLLVLMLCTCGSPAGQKTSPIGTAAVYLLLLMLCPFGTHAVYLWQPMVNLETYSFGSDAVYLLVPILCTLGTLSQQRTLTEKV